MFREILRHTWAKLGMSLLATFLEALSINLFIVPQKLYTGGLLGVCQLLRTLAISKLNLNIDFDFAGALYLFLNIPLLIMAWKNLGKSFAAKTFLCTAASSIFLLLIPIPGTPIIEDTLTSCLVGGILCGFSGGMILTCSCSNGGLDILGLCLAKKGKDFTVGKFSIFFNAFLYAICIVLFDVQTAIYSTIYTVFNSLFVDRAHQQSISVQAFIFTKEKERELSAYIMNHLERGVTHWEGKGGYTGENVSIICVCLNKYEIETLRQEVQKIDPGAFLAVQEGVEVGGNFETHFS